MPNNYPPEFRRQMVEQVRAGRTPEELAKEFSPPRSRSVPGCARPTRRQFLTAQAIIACDFLVVETMMIKGLYVLIFIERGTRKLHLAGVTALPTGARTVQQARNVVMDLVDRIAGLRFVIHDRDPLFTSAFGEVFTAEGPRNTTTLSQTLRPKAICERVIGTLPRTPGPDPDPQRTPPGLRAPGVSDPLQRAPTVPVQATATSGRRNAARSERDRPQRSAGRPPKTCRCRHDQRISPRRVTAVQGV
ncbi:hypothetical protein [Nonomuraea sp. NPDC049129]|uniref:hypothetical protein n=1 Tax=Nonomuraea sp. NPDC049129 TaxID=3155272 RepID=UPI0033F1F100